MNDPDGTIARADMIIAAPATVARTLWTVQVMRGLAALMVVVGHSQSTVGTRAAGGTFVRSTIIPWGAGVDLFFVISGFIIMYASMRLFGREGARGEFLRRRLIRIVPLYWIATSLFVLLLAAASWKGGDPFPSARGILSSYLFIPADTYADGRLFPVLDLGWTLNYEMFFYASLALVIAWPRRRALLAMGFLLGALAVAGFVLQRGSAPWFWTRPIILDFGLGIVVGVVMANGVTLPRAVRCLMAMLGLALLLADPAHIFDGPIGTTVANAWPRVVLAGLPVAAVLAAAVLGPEPAMPRIARPFTQVGDASYSLYLFHPAALISMEKVLQKVPAVKAAPVWLLVIVTILLALIIGFAVYRWVERPLTKALGRLVKPRSAAIARSPMLRSRPG